MGNTEYIALSSSLCCREREEVEGGERRGNVVGYETIQGESVMHGLMRYELKF